ncbi:MAG TPA: alpha/beta hydrolase [Thermoanaerobaculia bacterium]|nr:alpha/beta hydrolase [Thermoanaerobaculia bacterium]
MTLPEYHPVPLTGPEGHLDAAWHAPPGGAAPRFAAVVAHPHPLYGGSKDNVVVLEVARALVRAGGGALRFDFRGVGRSAGSHGGGSAELDDLLAAARLARELVAGVPLLVAGYSFGAIVALRWLGPDDRCAEHARPAAVLALAPPILHYDLGFLEKNAVPLGVLCGAEDALTRRDELARQTAAWGGVAATAWIEGAGHDLGANGQPHLLRTALDDSFGLLLQRAGAGGTASAPPRSRT